MSVWPIFPFLDAVTDSTRGNPKTPQSDYLAGGRYAVVDQGRKLIAGYTDDPELLYNGELPVILFGDHTRHLKYVDFPFSMGADGVKVLSPHSGWNPKFLYHYLSSLNIPSAGYSRHFKFLKEQVIPRPPMVVQRRVAEALDRADALRVKRRRALAHLDDLTQSIFLDMFGDPAQNSKRLPLVPLDDLGEWKSGGTPPRSASKYFKGQIPWFSSGELGDIYVSESNEKVSVEALTETSAKKVPRGAIMIGMYDTAALKTSIAAVDCSCNQAIAFASTDPRIAEPVYVYFALRVGREHFRRLQRGVRQKNLNLSMVREMMIPHPHLSLQKEFGERVIAVEEQRKRHRSGLAELDALFASLQDRAFKGLL